jgi:hypothetical protein
MMEQHPVEDGALRMSGTIDSPAMAGEEPQETGQSDEYDRVSLEKRYAPRRGQGNQLKKRQPALSLDPENDMKTTPLCSSRA